MMATVQPPPFPLHACRTCDRCRWHAVGRCLFHHNYPAPLSAAHVALHDEGMDKLKGTITRLRATVARLLSQAAPPIECIPLPHRLLALATPSRGVPEQLSTQTGRCKPNVPVYNRFDALAVDACDEDEALQKLPPLFETAKQEDCNEANPFKGREDMGEEASEEEDAFAATLAEEERAAKPEFSAEVKSYLHYTEAKDGQKDYGPTTRYKVKVETPTVRVKGDSQDQRVQYLRDELLLIMSQGPVPEEDVCDGISPAWQRILDALEHASDEA